MNRFRLLPPFAGLREARALAVGIAMVGGLMAADSRTVTVERWREQMAQALQHSHDSGAIWAVEVVHARSGTVLFQTNAFEHLIPASATKLFTTALALDLLGTNYQVFTRVSITAEPDVQGAVHGDLVVDGAGDPSFSSTWHEGNWEVAFLPLVRAVVQAGIRVVEGDLVVDDRALGGETHGRGWDPEDFRFEWGTGVSALTAGDNIVSIQLLPGKQPGDPLSLRWIPRDEMATAEARSVLGWPMELAVTTGPSNQTAHVAVDWKHEGHSIRLRGSVPADGGGYRLDLPVTSPAMAFGGYLWEALGRQMVQLRGKIRLASAGAIQTNAGSNTYRTIAVCPSPPIGQWIRPVLKTSQNLYAQLMFLTIGAYAQPASGLAPTHPRGAGLWEDAAIQRLSDLLMRAAIDPGDVRLVEGSGLARENHVTAHALVQLLDWVDRQPFAATWRDALPVAGVDGTLSHRMTQPPLKGNVRAKTGTLTGVSTLAGIVTTASGDELYFAILVNQWSQGSSSECRAEMDRIVEGMAAISFPP